MEFGSSYGWAPWLTRAIHTRRSACMKLIHRLLEATDEFGCVPEAMHRRFCLFSMKDFAAFSGCSIENPFAGQVEVPLEVEEAPQRYSLERAGWFHWISTFQQHENRMFPTSFLRKRTRRLQKKRRKMRQRSKWAQQVQDFCCPPKSLWTMHFAFSTVFLQNFPVALSAWRFRGAANRKRSGKTGEKQPEVVSS